MWDTWNTPGDLYRVIFLKKNNQLQFFRIMLHNCFAEKLQNCFVDLVDVLSALGLSSVDIGACSYTKEDDKTV